MHLQWWEAQQQQQQCWEQWWEEAEQQLQQWEEAQQQQQWWEERQRQWEDDRRQWEEWQRQWEERQRQWEEWQRQQQSVVPMAPPPARAARAEAPKAEASAKAPAKMPTTALAKLPAKVLKQPASAKAPAKAPTSSSSPGASPAAPELPVGYSFVKARRRPETSRQFELVLDRSGNLAWWNRFEPDKKPAKQTVWRAAIHYDSGYHYFWNTRDNSTQWHLPWPPGPPTDIEFQLQE